MKLATKSLPKISTVELDLSPAQEKIPGIYSTPIDGMYALPAKPHHDERGFFLELAKIADLNQVLEPAFTPKQINQAHSIKNVARGFHAEDWNKLVAVMSGECFCALADIRPTSKTFGTVVTVNLGHGTNSLLGALYLPKGVANSLVVLSEKLDYLYLVDKLYSERSPEGDQAIDLFDPTLAVEWPIKKSQMLLSDRDQKSTTLAELLQ